MVFGLDLWSLSATKRQLIQLSGDSRTAPCHCRASAFDCLAFLLQLKMPQNLIIYILCLFQADPSWSLIIRETELRKEMDVLNKVYTVLFTFSLKIDKEPYL